MEITEEENSREHTGRKEKQNAYEEWVYKEWVNSIRCKIPASSSKPFTPRPTIFRVPEHIRGGNENAYEPQVVSIGPYHRAKVKFVDEHKWRYVQAILQRNPNKSLEDYLNGIKELEDRARSCYQETTEIRKIESNDFVEMMFVDGCFLVELFLKRLDHITHEKETGHQDDIIYSDRLLSAYLTGDLCLLENQLPYSILECIFESVMSNQVNHLRTYFVIFATKYDHFLFFKKILSSDEANRSSLPSALLASLAITFIPSGFGHHIRSSHVAVGEKVSFHHLLHLFHYSLSPHPDIHFKKTPAKSNFQKLKNAIPSIFSRLCSYGSASSAVEIPEQSRSPAKSMSNTLKNIIPSNFLHLCFHGSASSAGKAAHQLRSPEKSMFKKLKSVIPSIFWRLPSHGSASSAGETALQLWLPSKSMFEKLKVGIRSIFWRLYSHGSTSSAARKLWSMPTATMLQEAGVKFKKTKDPVNLLNIKFDGGVMGIPHLFISKSFNLVFRNFIAFEQCHQGVPKYFGMYSYFMDCLINTPKDVEILRQHGIMEVGSDEEVALLFNRIVKGTLVYNDRYLSVIFKEVTEYCNTGWHRWRTTLCRDYFSSPWAILSIIAAIILLLLTVVQAFFSFLSYVRPPS